MLPMDELKTLNDAGEPGTLQRLVYRLARAQTHEEWRAAHALASELLEIEMVKAQREIGSGHEWESSPYLIMLNAICCATHEVRRLQNGLDRLFNRTE